jgi:hypothetical protein
VTSNFIKVLVKNISNTKAQLHESATATKGALIAFLSSSNLSSESSFKLFTQLFGPNTLTRLSLKKHADLFRVISARFDSAEVEAFFSHMKNLFENPNVEDTFGQLI